MLFYQSMMNNNETDKGIKPVDFNRYGLLAEQIRKNETGGLDFNFGGIGQRDAVEKKLNRLHSLRSFLLTLHSMNKNM